MPCTSNVIGAGGGGEGVCGRSTFKKIFVQGKILWKKNYARQAVLKNILKIYAEEILTRKIHAARKLPSPSPPPPHNSFIFFFNRKCHANIIFLSLIYLLKNVKQDGALYLSNFLVWSQFLFIIFFVALHGHLHLLLFITRKYAFICVKRRPTARRYIH